MSLSSACSYESIWNEKKKLMRVRSYIPNQFIQGLKYKVVLDLLYARIRGSRTGFLILCSLVGALPNFQKMFNMEEITLT